MNEHSTIQRFPLIGACRGRGKSLLIAVVTAFSAYVLSLSRLVATDYFVDTADDTVAADGKVSLREAIAASGSNQAVFDAPAGDTGTDVITFTSALNAATITLNDSAATVAIPGGPTVPLGGPLVVSDFLIMWDGNQTRVKIDAASKSRVFEIADGAKNVRLMNVRILNGSSAVSGGAIYVDAGEELELFDVIVSDSTAPDGGGIYNDGGKLTIDSSMVRDNAATGASGSGGGIFNNTGGTLVVKNSTVWANYANRAGGGIEDKSGPGLGVTLENTLLGKNNAGVLPAIAAPGNGGGLHVTGAGDVLITGGNSDGNVAAREGGALWNGTGTMTIDGTTIAGNLAKGSAADDGGGGIFNNGGTLAISNAEIRANIADGTSGSGGGILNLGGSVAIDSTLIVANEANRAGGGIEDSVGTGITITNSTLRENIAGPAGWAAPGNGGAVHITGAGKLELTGSTVADNVAAKEGGGLWNHGASEMYVGYSTVSGNTAPTGGGIFALAGAGVLDLVNSTVSGNTATLDGGGLALNGGNATFLSVTVAANSAAGSGGGLRVNGASVVSFNSLFGDNAAASGADVSGAFDLANNSLVESASGASGIADGVDGNIVGMDAVLGSLVDNGGPTLTHLPGAGSPAIDAGDSAAAAGLTGDQRGLVRIIGNVDMGSVELQMASVPLPFTDSVDANDGVTTLREMVIAANATPGSDTIELSAGTYVLTLPGSGEDVAATGDLDITDSLTITGAGPATIIDASALGDRVFEVFTGVDVKFSNLMITGGVAGDGGGIYNRGGVVDVSACIMQDNIANGASGSGGAIFNDTAGILTVSDSTISGNQANRAGGGIEDNSGAGLGIILTNVNLDGNKAGVSPATAAPGNGGGLHISGAGDTSIIGGTVNGNSAAREGGGLWNGSGTMTVEGVEIADNKAAGAAADDGGGGIFNNGGTLIVDTSDIRANLATGASGSGGGILNLGGSVTVTGTSIDANVANRAGGGIEDAAGTQLLLIATQMTDNVAGPDGTAAPGNGGALHISGAGHVELQNSTVAGNFAAKEGGGLWNSGVGMMSVYSSTVSGNSAPKGGGIFAQAGAAGDLQVTNSTVSGNTVTGNGAGIGLEGGSLFLLNSTVASNTATGMGGGIHITNSDVTLFNSIIGDNVAADGMDVSGMIGLASNTLIESGAGAMGISDGSDGNIVGQDAMLAPLANYGGTSETHLLMAGSAAINTGDDVAATGLTTDQRGLPRFFGAVDMGSVEKQDGEAGGSMVSTFADVVDANDGVVSLREAVIAANATAEADVIVLMPGTYALTLAGSGEDATATGDLDIAGSLSIVGAGDQTIIDASALGDRAFEVLAGSDATLSQLTITGGQADDGGAIYNRGTLDITKATLTNNVANGESGSGGAIFSAAGSVTSVTDSTISANVANRAGGGIEDASGAGLGLQLFNVVFDGNNAGVAPATAAPGNGGALHITGPGDVTISGGSVTNNVAAREGGGLWNGAGLMIIDDVMISANSAAGVEAHDGGGGVFNNGGKVEITGGMITGNSATGAAGSGGGIFNEVGGTVTVSGSTISANLANRAGGGIEDNSGAGLGVTLTNVMLDGNNAGVAPAVAAPGNGGAVHISGPGDIAITGGSVTNNLAAREGGGLWNGAGLMTIDGVSISTNSAAGVEAHDGGGGVFNNGGKVEITGGMINGNSATGAAGSGGGIFNEVGGTVTVSGSTISANIANRAGGG
ncbi:MAG: hypothetical protein KDN22_31125, partial [Verrucomicrobiae bacterium]|nr:hypothetical protein [Verrucomicrobiae bacterium]